MSKLGLELVIREGAELASPSGSATLTMQHDSKSLSVYQCTAKTIVSLSVSAKTILGVQSRSSREGIWAVFVKLLGTVGIFYYQCQTPIREQI